MSNRRPRLRVAVASDQSLVADSVRAALSGRGLEACSLGWPGQGSPAQGRPADTRYDVGLLISDLDRWARLRGATLLVGHVRTRWIVLTAAPPGPLWGAVLEAGAALVLPASTSLEDTAKVMEEVAAGRLATPADDRHRLVEQWTQIVVRRQVVDERLRSLTQREREVLRLLYTGESVARIAELFEVSQATVRSQVKSVLRKLDVTSQLAAVATVGEMIDPERDDPGGRLTAF